MSERVKTYISTTASISAPDGTLIKFRPLPPNQNNVVDNNLVDENNNKIIGGSRVVLVDRVKNFFQTSDSNLQNYIETHPAYKAKEIWLNDVDDYQPQILSAEDASKLKLQELRTAISVYAKRPENAELRGVLVERPVNAYSKEELIDLVVSRQIPI
jgi:hypothetical protein